MQIDFASSGSPVNEELTYSVDTDNLPEEQAQELERLVETSGAFDLEQDQLLNEAAAGSGDVTAYRLTLSAGDRKTTLWFNDVTAPTSLRPLLERLRELALGSRRNRGQAHD